MNRELLAWHARRAAAGLNVLNLASWICLVASCAFWLNIHWTLLAPWTVDASGAGTLSLSRTIIAVTMGLVYAIVLPVLWSMLLPSTPAGMLLQSTRLRTAGFVFVIAATMYLSYHAGTMLLTWWAAQPLVAATDQIIWMTFACLIAFIGIPAITWVQTTPEQWADQIRQAHLVHRLRMQHNADIAILKITLLRAQQKAAAGIANLLPAERQELVATLQALFQGQNETIRAIAGTFQHMADFELEFPTMGDERMSQAFHYVAQELDRSAETVRIPPALTSTSVPDAGLPPASIHDVLPAAASRVADRPGDSAGPLRTIADRRAGDEQALQVARRELHGAWRRADLEQTLGIQKSAACDFIKRWKAQGIVTELSEPKFHYAFREERP
jgi:hypothetical protein